MEEIKDMKKYIEEKLRYISDKINNYMLEIGDDNNLNNIHKLILLENLKDICENCFTLNYKNLDKDEKEAFKLYNNLFKSTCKIKKKK